MALRSHLQTKT